MTDILRFTTDDMHIAGRVLRKKWPQYSFTVQPRDLGFQLGAAVTIGEGDSMRRNAVIAALMHDSENTFEYTKLKHDLDAFDTREAAIEWLAEDMGSKLAEWADQVASQDK